MSNPTLPGWFSLAVAALSVAASASACSGGSTVRTADVPPPPFVLPQVADQALRPLIEAHLEQGGLYLYSASLDDLGPEALAIEGLPDDPWGDCEPDVMDAPAELGAFADLTPPAERVFLVFEGGVCPVEVGPAAVLIGQSYVFCEATLAFPLGDIDPACAGGDSRGGRAPVAVVADSVAPDLHWVAAGDAEVELEPNGAGTARLVVDGVASELSPPEEEWDADLRREWQERVLEEGYALSVHADAARVATPIEAVENRAVSWFFLAGTDPAAADCYCDDWETGERIPGCIDEYYEKIASRLGLVLRGEFVELEERWDYPRGALVEGGRIGVLVTGYNTGVATHRRTGETAFAMAETEFPLPVHEEDNELPLVMQEPYCGP